MRMHHKVEKNSLQNESLVQITIVAKMSVLKLFIDFHLKKIDVDST